MQPVRLKPYIRPGLDVLFVALNPSEQANANGHYFSGKQARFFKMLGMSGLTTVEVDKLAGDDLVFGGNEFNYRGAQYGVTDLVDDLVQTDSARVKVEPRHVAQLLARIREFEPRFVCVIHSKVRDQLNSSGELSGPLEHRVCGPLLAGCRTDWLFNYFSNGNNKPDSERIPLYAELRRRL